MKHEMKNKKLEFCTTYPNAIFIATDVRHNDKVLGIVGCEKLDSYSCELNRLTVLPNARYLIQRISFYFQFFKYTVQAVIQ